MSPPAGLGRGAGGGGGGAGRGLRAVGISGSPSAASKSRALVEHALGRLGASGAETVLLDLAALPADALLGRRTDPGVTGALAAVGAAHVIVAGTPVYRATYSGLLKVFFDLLPQDALAGKIGIPLVTGHAAAHALAVDHGLRPLFASLGGAVVARAVYALSGQFPDGRPEPALLRAVDGAVMEALAWAGAAGAAGAAGPGGPAGQ